MRWLCVIVVAALLALAGCGGRTAPSAAPDGAATGSGKVADLRFTGTTLEGDRFEGAALEGKPSVLWFWAPWCPTCRAQISTVSKLAEEYDGRVAVVGVGGLDSREAIEDLAADIPHVTHLVDAKGVVWKHFRVTEQSAYTVLDADGRVVSEGYLDHDEIVSLVARLAG